MPPDADPDTTAKRIINAVDAAGYGASLATAESENAELEDTETPKLKKRLIASLCFFGAADVCLDGAYDRSAAGQCVPRRRLARHPVCGHPAGADAAGLLD